MAINVDEGAKAALVDRGASLLPSGITSIEGNFNQGEAVEICFEKQVIAKGLALYNARDLMLIKITGKLHE